ncbi:hypothetical protein Vadar_027160 [Vaccinium darrowii]|uniref:Uncharacterized protein n=1 Tax=Vaccinium darrowii TaxID=229202 RepID=A0ACB7Z6T1_9ERIC|nr:hypothetical protein Vadar_027160 [Vaccinium darrowii]
MWYFLKGLRPDIHGRVSLLDVKTLAELVTKALTAENDIKEENMSKGHQFKRTREWWQPGQNNEGGNSNKRSFNEGHQGTLVLILVGCAIDRTRKVQAKIISQKYKNIEFYEIDKL